MRDFISNGLILILSLVSGSMQGPTEKKQTDTCRVTSMGSPCAQGGVATLGNPSPGRDFGTGNPIDLRSGNKYQRETDLPRQVTGLELIRHYNAMDPRISALGRGWSWSYDARIYLTGQQLQLIQADASRLVFNCADNLCRASAGTHGQMHRQGLGWVWVWPTGKKLYFDGSGWLVRMSTPAGQEVLIQRHPEVSRFAGLIERVSAGGQQLNFEYDVEHSKPKIARVHTPRGLFLYHHNQPVDSMTPGKTAYRLISVTRPDAMRRTYHYESQWQSGNVYALTGISIVQADVSLRTHSWRYDEKGRADLFIPGLIDQSLAYKGISFNQKITGVNLLRDVAGNVSALNINQITWPDLHIKLNRDGKISSWQMRGVGAETWLRDDKVVQRNFADQTVWKWKFDRHQRMISMRAQQRGNLPETTRINWRGLLPVVIEHPQETQVLRYARHTPYSGQLREREIFRPATQVRPAWSYRERFVYNDAGQRIRHQLPEGGSLHYWWKDNRLLSIEWHDVKGVRHRIIDSTAAGIRHGNGLVTSSMKTRAGLSDLMVYQPLTKTALFHQQLRYSQNGTIAAETIRNGVRESVWNYRRDPLDRLLPAQWPMNRTRVQRDATGLPSRIGDYLLEYGPMRRLRQVSHISKSSWQIHYAHNASGERIWRDDGAEQTHYLFDQNKVVAQAQVLRGQTEIVRRYIYAHHVPIAVIENNRNLYMIHADAVGLPRLLTDMQQKIRWQGDFSPYGELLTERGDLTMPLRFPGQIADDATGWHDNYQRTYDPRWGQYLEPDPLGPMPGNTLYGYANQQPRRHADPLGLMLFAFDGTGNQPSSLTNIWLFSKAYRDGPVHYMAGPAGDAGMSSTDMKTDMAVAWSGGARVDQQWDRLLNAVANLSEQNQTIPIDIVGFSRGAALARHFGNRVVDHVREGRFWLQHPLHGVISSCMDLRFLGLFDTVAQFNVLGSGNAAFNLTIAPAWKWVSHAVALHEHRWLFPLTSAAGSSNVVERAFVGAHADIGGGYLSAEASPGSTPGNLSQVALAWMQWQAEAAGVALGNNVHAQGVTEAFLHDERAVFSRKGQNGDRRVNHADGRKWVNYQADLPQMGQALRKEVEAFIHRPPEIGAWGTDVAGLVDMAGYIAWLKDSMGLRWE